MAEFKLGRIRFVYQGEWADTTSYVVDDVVTVNGKTYICVISHTSSSLFSTDQQTPPTKWNLMADGTAWQGDWTASTLYQLGDQVKYGGTIYVCTESHTSATYTTPDYLGLEEDAEKWEAFATTLSYKGAWATSTRYKVRDLVTYGGITYLCKEKHISDASASNGLEQDSDKWDTFTSGVTYVGTWSGSSVRYKLNDVVTYGADLWICTTQHTSSATFDSNKFQVFVSGLQFEDTWSNSTAYQVGDITTYGGNVYVATQNHTNQNPSTATSYWKLFTTGFKYSGDWDLSTAYKVGDVVRVGGYTYVATADSTNHTPPNTSYWQRLNSGLRWAPTNDTYTNIAGTNISSSGSSATFDITTSGTSYSVSVNTAGSSYALNDTINIAGDDVGGLSPANDIVVTVTGVSSGSITSVEITGSASTWGSGVTYVLGDVVFFGANSYICIQAHVGSAGSNRPDVDTSGTYWNLLAGGSEQAVLTTDGDIFYYSANGPARLPVGTDGQILRVDNGLPAWSYYGLINNVVYVSPAGEDTSSNGAGLTIDKPWKTIQFACQQIEAGYLNTDATALLEKNKQFIIKEVNNYVQNTYPGVCDPDKTERDAGIVLDAIIYDIGHGGNLNTTNATLAYYDSTGTDYINSTVSSQITEFIAGQTYLKSIINDVLANTVPDVNYQTLESVATPAEQIIDLTLSPEADAIAKAPTLVDIVIAGLGAGTTSKIVAGTVPATTIRVMTGTYNEVLPIVVPRNTAIVGDELRSSVVQPKKAIDNLVNDKPKSISSLNRIKAIIPDLIANNTVTPSTGNTETQVTTLPAGSVGSTTAVESVISNIGLIQDILSNGVTELPAFIFTNPTNYNTTLVDTAYASTGYATGNTANFGDGKAQIVQNYQFIKDEIQAYLTTVRGTWSSYTAAAQSSTLRDVGYILDAIQYDMTYGGNRQSLIAGSAYYSNNIIQISSTYLADTLAALAWLKSFIDNIVIKNTAGWVKNTSSSQVVTGTAGSAAAGAFAQDRIQDIIDWINNGTANATIEPYKAWASSALQTSFNAIQDRRSEIQSDTVVWIQKYFQQTDFDQSLASRDAGDIVDALSYDAVLGSNFNSVIAGRRYYSSVDSADVVLTTLLNETRDSINFIGYKTKIIAAAGASAQAQAIIDDAVNYIDGGATPRLVWPDFTGVDAENAAAAKLIWRNKAFIQAELIEYINTTYTSVEYSEEACSRDVGYIVDAIRYDLTYGGNFATRQAAVAYYSQLTSSLVIDSGDLTATTAAYGVLKTIVQDIANGGLSTYTPTQLVVGYISGTGGDSTSATTVGNLIQAMINYITDPVANPISESLASTSWVDSTLTASNTALQSARTTIRSNVISYINTNFPGLTYDSTTCSRDIGYVIDAIGYDLMFGSNFRSVKAGLSYYQAQASLVLLDQKEATLACFNYLKLQIESTLTDTTALARASANMQIIIDIINYGDKVTPEINGTVTYNNTLDIINGAEILRANKEFIAQEASAWIKDTFGGTVTATAATTNLISTSNSHNLTVGDPVRFTSTTLSTTLISVSSTGNWITLASTTGLVVNTRITFTGVQVGNIIPGTVYYVNTIGTGGNVGKITIASTYNSGTPFDPGTASGTMVVTAGGVFGGVADYDINGNAVEYYVLTTPTTKTFTITATKGSATPVALSNANGVATATYYFVEESCLRDSRAYVDALVYDLQFTGNYKTLRAAKLYNNAVSGSTMENMFLVRNGSGLRNMTWTGLRGTLTNENEYGTRRPTAGAYASLDEGFGPNDTNVWINSRSCYTQNITMFGNGCSGGKVDGALHAGGYRSMVANDFTAIISDGIGYWVTGSNAVAELVSVFNYYGYAGYMAELGGKIRATNGNSSYGTYGVVAEGVDTYEAPINGLLNNRGSEALITNVVTDAVNEVLRFEYANAGTGYTNSVATISGSGYNAAATHDEFRDRAVFETRLIDRDDGQGYGGSSYVTATNVAQTGAVGSVTIAATDIALSTAYVGMRIQIIAGTGVGQYANILSYNNGTKEALIYKDSFTTVTVTGSTTTVLQASAADVATLYVNMPIYLGTDASNTGLSANTLYYVESLASSTSFKVKSSLVGSAITGLTATSTQTIPLYAAGWDHVIPGNDTDDILDLTSGYIIEPRINYTAPGYTATARTMSATATWTSATYGNGKFVAIASGGTSTSYSSDGKTWASAGAQPSSQTWGSLVYAGGEGASVTAVIGGLGGAGAVLTPIIGTGTEATQIIGVTVTNGGYGYTTAPVITFTGGGGSGATATALVLDGSIKEIVMDINGSGYTSAPTVTANTSRLTDITVNSWGQNYFGTVTVSVAAPFSATAWSSGGAGTSGTYYSSGGLFYKATSNGTFTTTAPTHTSGTTTNGTVSLLYVGKQATVTATLTNGGVSTYTITEKGDGYSAIPTISVTDSASRFVAISTASNNSSYQTPTSLGSTWSAGGSTGKTNLASLAYGSGLLVAVGGASGTATAVSSSDGGATWIDRSSNITALGAGSYSAVAYGNGTFVAIQTGGIQTSFCTGNPGSWTAGGNLPNLGSNLWTSIAYGNGRFVAIQGGASASTYVAYSTDKGVTWTQAPAGIGSSQTWQKIKYGQGLFFAIASGTNVCATSPDGVNWTVRAMPGSSTNWKALTFGNPLSVPLWVAASNTSSTTGASIRTGAQALGRMKVVAGEVTEIRMIEPGSGYPAGSITATTASTNIITTSDTTNLVDLQPVEFTGLDSYGLTTNVTYYVIGSTIVSNTSFKVASSVVNAGLGTAVTLTTGTGLSGTYTAGPTVTQYDPNKVNVAGTRVRVGNGALGNPSFSNRGANNATATASTTGDGFADTYQNTAYINVSGLYSIPAAGANVEFASIPGQWYKLVAVTNVLGSSGNFSAQFQINPALTTLLSPAHNDVITTQLKYSQVRLTGHDFLYVGSGNQTDTNYPYVDTTSAIQSNQELAVGGGRVFFTSTDQDGNFNVGNLFGVQQATGTATLNASAFNLAGLQSLQLGAVTLGVGSAIITQFSTDPYFTANSDAIVPTQRAIKAFITAQIGGGASSLNVNTITSGQIYIANNSITNTTGEQILVTSKMNFVGGIDGAPVALTYFGQK